MDIMHVHQLHPWDLSPKAAIALQRTLAESLTDAGPFRLETARRIAGVDVSSSKDSPLLTAGVVVWDRETESVTEAVWAQQPETFPYVPGLLSFREIPVLCAAIAQLSSVPDAFLVDGHGRAHPRRLGIAAHLGLLLDVPTVGVAKSILTGRGEEPGVEAGSHTPLMDGTERIGEIVRLRNHIKPVYVSAGNRITMDDAVELVLACARGYRLPEPTRLAHEHVNLARTTGHGMAVSGAAQATLL